MNYPRKYRAILNKIHAIKQRFAPPPKLTHYIFKEAAIVDAPFTLLDVGAIGGIQKQWYHFAPYLVAFGFDPLVNEIERNHSDSKIKYFPYFVVSENDEIDNYQSTGNPAINRSSAKEGERILAAKYIQKSALAQEQTNFSDNMISLDRFCIE